MSAAIYAGSFDPITNGHVSIIHSGLVAFDRIIVAVLSNSKKDPLFSVEERIEMIADAIKGDPRVEIDRFDDGLLVDYARKKGVRVVLRGLLRAGAAVVFEHGSKVALAPPAGFTPLADYVYGDTAVQLWEAIAVGPSP